MRTPFAGFLFVAFLATVAARAFPHGDYAPATPARRSRSRVGYTESLLVHGSSSTSDGLGTAGRRASSRDATPVSTLGNSDDAVEARVSSPRVTARSVEPEDAWATVSRPDGDDWRDAGSSSLDDETHDPFPSAVEGPRDRNARALPFLSAVDGDDAPDAPDPDAPYLSVDDIPDPDGALDDEASGEEDEDVVGGVDGDERAGGMDVEMDDEDRALDGEFNAEFEAAARRSARDDRRWKTDELEDERDVELMEDARIDDASSASRRRSGPNDYEDVHLR